MFLDKATYLNDCIEFCKSKKYVAEPWDWQDKPNKSGQLVATSALLDENLATVRGVRLYGRYHLGEDTGFEYIHFGINLMSGFRSRVCGLDVHPEFERSHTDALHKHVYGPHYHVGDHKKVGLNQHRVVPISPDFLIDNLPRWIEIFKENARVLVHNGRDVVAPPLDRDLFGPNL